MSICNLVLVCHFLGLGFIFRDWVCYLFRGDRYYDINNMVHDCNDGSCAWFSITKHYTIYCNSVGLCNAMLVFFL